MSSYRRDDQVLFRILPVILGALLLFFLLPGESAPQQEIFCGILFV